MGTTNVSGPFNVIGSMGNLPSALGGSPVPDYDPDAGPSGFYQGIFVPDVRIVALPDRMQGRGGSFQGLYSAATIRSIGAIPMALGAAKIAAAANTVAATAMTLAVASPGVAKAIPWVPLSGLPGGGTVVTANIVLDFGFAYVATTAASATVTVADSTAFTVGMPLVIAAVGNSGGTTALLTSVASLASATTITVDPNNVPAATNTSTPCGTGNLWLPQETASGASVPTAHMPFLGVGTGLVLDPRQSIARVVSITCNNSSGATNVFTVVGYDVYGVAMSEAITITPGSALVAYGKKPFKVITSVTPSVTEATYTYSIGTGDVFGFHVRTPVWEDCKVSWAGALMTSSQGFTAPVATTPATTTTGDTRGVIQTGAAGGGTGIGSTATNGSVSGTTVSGRYLLIETVVGANSATKATQADAVSMFGVTQA